MFALFPPLGLVQQILDLVGVVNAVELDNARHRVNDGRHLAVDFLLVAQYGILDPCCRRGCRFRWLPFSVDLCTPGDADLTLSA